MKCVIYSTDFTIQSITSYNKNKCHNKNGSATLVYYSACHFEVMFIINGMVHSLKHPAKIEKVLYENKETILNYIYVINGKYIFNIKNNKQFKKYIKLQNIK